MALVPLSCRATAAGSLVADLSRESWRLRRRASQVQAALTRCRHRGLRQRLRSELTQLLQRRQQLGQLCSELQAPEHRGDSLPLALLAELCRRPLLPI